MFPARLGVQHPQDRPGLRRLPAVPVRPTLGLQEAGLGVGGFVMGLLCPSHVKNSQQKEKTGEIKRPL